MNKHTQGPWEFLGDPDDDECRIRQAASVKNGRGYSSEITICENIHTQANARLIAAAPDLLHALQNIENDNGQIPDHAWKVIQDAIAKATINQ